MALIDRFERFLDQVIPAPDEAVEATRRGVVLFAAGEVDGALRLADHARRVAPGYLAAVALRCDALVAMGRPYDALAELDTVGATRPLPVDLLARMAELVAAQGPASRVGELDAHLRARVRPPEAAVARRMLSGALALLRWDPALALRYARTATVADPACAGAWAMLGDDAVDRGDLARARALLARAAGALDAADAIANARVGALAERLGEHDLAVRGLRRAWIAGDDLAAHARLVGLLALRGDTEALARTLKAADPVVTGVARAILAADRGESVSSHLAGIAAAAVPAALWAPALGAALRGAPAIAARWVTEAPDRPHAPAAAALAQLGAGDALALEALRDAATTALGDPATAPLATEALRAALVARWSPSVPRCLDELPQLLAACVLTQAFAASISLHRKEIDGVLRVAVLGEFSAGKSTFVNALVGREVSPMGVLPTTAAVHWLRYGEDLARVIDVRGAVVECAVADTPGVLARRHREGVPIDRVEVSLLLPRLAGVEIVDTPGFNAGDPEHERAARAALEIVDLALWLFDARQAGRHSEREPLEVAQAAGVPVVGVLNKVDQVPADGRVAVESLLRRELGSLAPLVAAVSARTALAATHAGDGGALDASGWTEFSHWIDHALIDAREGWKRARAARRAARDLTAARAALDAADAARREATAARAALAEEIDSLRDALRAEAAVTGRDAALALRDQARGLREARTRDASALLDDAASEVVWRASRRALDALRPRLDRLEGLAVTAGLVPASSRELATAPGVAWLEQVVLEAARQALSDEGSSLAPSRGQPTDDPLPGVDPLSILRALLDRSVTTADLSEAIARIALDAAVTTLARCIPPTIAATSQLVDAMPTPSG